MNSESNPPASARNTLEAKQLIADYPADADSVVDILGSHLMAKAGKRTIQQAVAGGRFCAVMLDDGGVGVANLCPDVCGEPSRCVSDQLPQPGTLAADALATLAPPTRSAIGLATANALANRFPGCGGLSDEPGTRGDLLKVLELRPDDHVGMVGCFYPLVEGIRRRVQRLSIFERGQRLSPDLLPEGQAAELLPRCSVAIITATTLINGTIDKLLTFTQNCREVVLLGPSTPLVPEVFAKSPRRVTLLAGMVVTNAEELLRTVARDGSTRDFKTSMAKVNVKGIHSVNP
ncbi:MAG: DUF364 domain-containing protein [Phycisphaerae bacterium]|nr:DUF364 domain-containing protein [Phycisphaerae bacterium]